MYWRANIQLLLVLFLGWVLNLLLAIDEDESGLYACSTTLIDLHVCTHCKYVHGKCVCTYKFPERHVMPIHGHAPSYHSNCALAFGAVAQTTTESMLCGCNFGATKDISPCVAKP